MRRPRMVARFVRACCTVAGLVAGLFPSASLRAQQPAPPPAGLTTALATVASPDLPTLPAAERFTPGPRSIAAGTTVTGPVAVANGAVDVTGTVTGDVVTWRGDIVVHTGGVVTGNAIAIGGVVRLDGGQVHGQTLTVDDAGSAPVAAPARILDRLAIVAGWLAIALAVSVGVLVFAPHNLSAVADVLERHYGSTLVAGLAGQLALAPVLLAIVVALVLSLLGILLIPFAIVVYVIIAAGVVTLGLLATAVVIGRGWRSAPPGTERARTPATLRALVVGIVVLLSPWLVAALLALWPTAELIARGMAFTMTWVAATAGLGATLISRAGIKRAESGFAKRAMSVAGWQTPTPVSGVAAARRPAQTPSPTAGGR